jgi:hypothetical protein
MIQIADASGRVLSDVDLRPGDSPDILVIVSAAAPEALMRHYFRGGRTEISLQLADQRIEGRIETRWERGARVWRIRLSAPLDARNLESLSANHAAPGMRPMVPDPAAARGTAPRPGRGS